MKLLSTIETSHEPDSITRCAVGLINGGVLSPDVDVFHMGESIGADHIQTDTLHAVETLDVMKFEIL